MKRLILPFIISLSLILLLIGCSGKNPVPSPFQPDGGLPYTGVDIVSHIPLANITNAATNLPQVRITFNSNMSTFNLNLITIAGPGSPTFISASASNNVVILDLSSHLRPSMEYTISIPGSIKTVNGTIKSWPYQFTFTTVDAVVVHGTTLGTTDKIYIMDGIYKRVIDNAYGPFVNYPWAGNTKDIIIQDAPVSPIVARLSGNIGGTIAHSHNYGTKAATNLSQFSNGYFVMWYKTAKTTDMWLELTSTGEWPGVWVSQFGWTADDQWHKLKIPLRYFTTDPYRLDLSLAEGFYEFTGNNKPGGAKDYVYVNSMYWSMTTN